MKFEPMLGAHISKVIQEAIALSREHNEAVEFNFNGVTLIAKPDSVHDDVAAYWQAAFDERQRAYEASPEYAAAQRYQEEQVRAAQAKIDHLIPQLDRAIDGGPLKTLAWLRDFAEAADHTGLIYFRDGVIADLSRIAPANTNVGRDDLKEPGNEEAAALWVIGQAVACMERGMPPHPVTVSFADKILTRNW